MDVDAEDPAVSVRWPVWHGSKDLLLRVLRLAERCVADHGGAAVDPTCLYVKVGADREEFETIDEFAERVTSDALRNFSRIWFEVGQHPEDLFIRVRFEREGKVLDTGRARLEIWSAKQDVAEAVEKRVTPALNRGCTQFDRAWRHPAGIAVVVFITLFVQDHLFGWLDSWAAAGVGTLVGVFVWVALYAVVPAVEIADPGKSRLERTRGVAVGIAIGLIGTGLGKAIYG